MATHSTIFAWRIPWTEKPDGFTKGQTQLKRLSMHTSGLFRSAVVSTWSHGHLNLTPLNWIVSQVFLLALTGIP